MQLPGEAKDVDLVAEVRYRKVVDELVQFGLAFDWKATKHGQRIRERIEAYVSRRTREVMDQAMGPDPREPAQ